MKFSMKRVRLDGRTPMPKLIREFTTVQELTDLLSGSLGYYENKRVGKMVARPRKGRRHPYRDIANFILMEVRDQGIAWFRLGGNWEIRIDA